MEKEEIDADKMTRFIRMNELRLVTEYNPTVISSSSLPSPQHLASSIAASSGSSVYAWGCVQGLPQWCRWSWGKPVHIFAVAEWRGSRSCIGLDRWGGERIEGTSSGLPVDLRHWWAKNCISYRSCCFFPGAFVMPYHAYRSCSARILSLWLRNLKKHGNPVTCSLEQVFLRHPEKWA